ncbi:MAG: TetR family transcriptional regulator [Lachnoclostridium sp.]
MNTKGDYMERKGEMTKRLLGESFKELMQKKPFDKITIKMITDGAGVIRPTFYNYFQDKYDVMEWLLEQDAFIGARELIHMNMQREAVKMIFRKLEAERQYYVRAFEVEGQNSFEEMLVDGIYSIIQTALELHPMDMHGFDKCPSARKFL